MRTPLPLLVFALMTSISIGGLRASGAEMIEYDVNGSFENLLRGWESTKNTTLISDSDGYGQSRKTADRVGAQDRRYFVAIEADFFDKNEKRFSATQLHPLSRVRPGDTIVVSGYVRSDIVQGQRAFIGVHLYDGRFFPSMKINEDFGDHSAYRTVTTEWEFVSSATHIPEDFDLEDIAVMLRASSEVADTRVFFDNVQVVVFRER